MYVDISCSRTWTTPDPRRRIGEKKLTPLITPSVKSSSTSAGSSSSSTSIANRKPSNTLLKSSKKFMPYDTKCRVCKQTVHQAGRKYCQGCAYKNGICAMCGTKILDTSGYKMASK
ncbi:microtubule-associated protein CRIPT-domain-containing protein [Gaertneriomyces semiglobifer]|nr:microtubule-associated protein CRIPT-domain-containing protein [Gaertneriomyces semiglobifer]